LRCYIYQADKWQKWGKYLSVDCPWGGEVTCDGDGVLFRFLKSEDVLPEQFAPLAVRQPIPSYFNF